MACSQPRCATASLPARRRWPGCAGVLPRDLPHSAPSWRSRSAEIFRSPDEPTGRANARPMTGSAISGAGAHVIPDIAALIRATRKRATSKPSPELKRRTTRPAILQIAPGVGSPGGVEHSTRAKIHFFFDFLAFFALAFFAFFAFLAIVSSQGFMD